MLEPILFLIFSYFLGSIPFGYLICRWSSRKNILEIGWRKTSGSNVFKNVGSWQGVATGLGDIGKGFLAVWLAQYFGFSLQIQALAGAAAVLGHNWSVFLRFAGGRGIGTLIGALLALSPEVLWPSLIPLILLAVIWNAAVGTIVFLVLTLALSVYLKEFQTAGVFILVCLLPIFIKRLSPLGELATKEKGTIRNRLLFDDDIPRWDLRIERIVRKLRGG